MDKEREEPCIVIDATGHKNAFAWIFWILNNFQQQNREKKKPTAPHCPSYSSSLPCCSSTQDGPRGVLFCFVILVYSPLSALSPSAWGGFFCCCCSSMAVCQCPEALSFPVTTLCWLYSLCLEKSNLLMKMRHANLFSIPGNWSFPLSVNTYLTFAGKNDDSASSSIPGT